MDDGFFSTLIQNENLSSITLGERTSFFTSIIESQNISTDSSGSFFAEIIDQTNTIYIDPKGTGGGFFAEIIKDVSGMVASYANVIINEGNCVQVDDVFQYLDWRDFLLEPAKARELGATGSQPYGDVAPLGFGIL